MTQSASPPTVPEGAAVSRGIPVGRPFGIPVYFSPSWLVIAAYITYAFADAVARFVDDIGNARYAVSFALAVLLALSVLAHELAHCVVGKALGLPVRQVRIFLLGGVSEIDEEPQTAGREYLVAVAGPLVSVLLGGVGSALVPVFDDHTVPQFLAYALGGSNALVAAFNLLPGLPLDGGRVVRAAGWQVTRNRVTGTRIAAYGGRGLAVVLVAGAVALGFQVQDGRFLGTNVLFSLLLAGFIWIGATAALKNARFASRIPSVTVRALVRRALPVDADLPLAEALRRAEEADARGLIVVDSDGHPDAMVSESAVLAVPEQRRPWVSVGSLARRIEDEGMILDADLTGADVLEALRRYPASEYLVVDREGEVVGVLAAADVSRQVDGKAAARA